MAELRRGFTKGGMNLDIDERLVPKGQYREAVNTRSGTATEGNEGSLEPVEGVFEQDANGTLGVSPDEGAKIVGTCVDKSSEFAYHLIKESTFDELNGSRVKADAIYEFQPNQAGISGKSSRVFNDVWEISTPAGVVSTDQNTGQTYIVYANADSLNNLDIRENMRILTCSANFVTDDGEEINVSTDSAFFVDYVDRASSRVYVKDAHGKFNEALNNLPTHFKFVSKRILRFDGHLITGLNVFDGMLFFTDNQNEPKKFNIKKCKLGSLSTHTDLDGANSYNPISPAWITNADNKKYFHTRLLVENSKSIVGAFGVPYYQNKGTFAESHATVIRPNPEEHIKVRTSADTFIPESVGFNGPTQGVMTHPFAIHPTAQPGDQITFLVAYINEVGMCQNINSTQQPNVGVDEPSYGFGALENYYGNPNDFPQLQKNLTLRVDSALVTGGRDVGLYSDDLVFTSIPGNLITHEDTFGYHGYTEEDQYNNYLTAENLISGVQSIMDSNPSNYHLTSQFYNLLDSSNIEGGAHTLRVMFSDYVDILGPAQDFGEGNDSYDAESTFYDNEHHEGGFLSNFMVGNLQNSVPSSFHYHIGLGEFFDPKNPKSAPNIVQEVLASAVGDDDLLIALEDSQYGNLAIGNMEQPNSLGGLYVRGGLLSQSNIIQGYNDNQPSATISQFWGMGENGDQMFHNGEMEINEVGVPIPTAPGQFVTPPHGFKEGDIVTLRGRGNMIDSGAVGRLKSQKSDGTSYYTYPETLTTNRMQSTSTLDSFQGSGNTVDSYGQISSSGNQNQLPLQTNEDGSLYLGGQGFEYDGNSYVSGFAHDGFMDTVKAKVVSTKMISIDPDKESTWYDDGSNDGPTSDIRDRFLLLHKNLHGMGTQGDDVLFDNSGYELAADGNVISEPSVFGNYKYGDADGDYTASGRYLTQYAITIEIVENNAKKDTDPTLRAMVDKNFYTLDGDNIVTNGHGDYTKNAAVMQRSVSENGVATTQDLSMKKSPYFDADMGFGGVYNGVNIQTYSVDSGAGGSDTWFNQRPKFYGPPLPQVWDIALSSSLSLSGGSNPDNDLKENMLRFSYRYQYTDNEYSGLAPFTNVIWRTLNQEMQWPNYYISLYNEITDLQLLDFVPKNIPEDVTAVEILVTKEDTPTVWAMQKYKFTDNEFINVANTDYRGLHTFNGDTLGLPIDPSQMTRPWDAVPKRALAQEVTGNRLVYGNHIQDYNLQEGIDFYEEQMLDTPGTSYVESYEDIRVKLIADTFKYTIQDVNAVQDASGNQINIGQSAEVAELNSGSASINSNYGKPFDSLKSLRSYQVGIVYRDEYGRETPVLTNKEAIIKLGTDASRQSNRIKVEVLNPHPAWAKSYKFFVKDLSQDYHTLALKEYFQVSTGTVLGEDENTDQMVSILMFKSEDVNKVQVGDILVQKKAHKISSPPDPVLSTATASHEPKNPGLKYEVQKITGEPPKEIQGVNVNSGLPEHENKFGGMFFVYVKSDNPLTSNNNVGSSPPGAAKSVGIFETLPRGVVDSDLYFEASQAYPIVLDDKTDSQWVKAGRLVTAYDYTPPIDISDQYNYSGGAISAHSLAGDTVLPTQVLVNQGQDDLVDAGEGQVTSYPVYVTKVETLSGQNNYNSEIYSELHLSEIVTLTATQDTKLVLRLETNDPTILGLGEHVYVEVAEDVVNSKIVKIKRHTHHSNFGITNDTVLPIVLPWYNCFSMGNGIELSTVNNSFFGMRLGKGVKASTVFEDYRETFNDKELIFSGVYNSFSSFNESNQFNLALGITKRFNPNNGSIQKLHTRSGDLIVLCEDKILKVLADKDALFNSDGTTNLSATNKVLGQSIPFEGEYGISKNPESFASHGFRSYFTDRKRGVVLRLSKDGLTVISDVGLDSYFKERLAKVAGDDIIGSFDVDKMEYLVSCEKFDAEELGLIKLTAAWDEVQNVWPSFRTYLPEAPGYSIGNSFYSHYAGKTYEHVKTSANEYFSFYNNPAHTLGAAQYDSDYEDARISIVYNEAPGTVKDFNTATYEGSQARIIANTADGSLTTNYDRDGWWIESINTDMERSSAINFLNKENKWFKYLTGGAMSALNEINIQDYNDDLTSDQAQSLIGIGSPASPVELENYELFASYTGVLPNFSFDSDWNQIGTASGGQYGLFSVPYGPGGAVGGPVMGMAKWNQVWEPATSVGLGFFSPSRLQDNFGEDSLNPWTSETTGATSSSEELFSIKLELLDSVTINEVNITDSSGSDLSVLLDPLTYNDFFDIDFSGGYLLISQLTPSGDGDLEQWNQGADVAGFDFNSSPWTPLSFNSTQEYSGIIKATKIENGNPFEVEIPFEFTIPMNIENPTSNNNNEYPVWPI